MPNNFSWIGSTQTEIFVKCKTKKTSGRKSSILYPVTSEEEIQQTIQAFNRTKGRKRYFITYKLSKSVKITRDYHIDLVTEISFRRYPTYQELYPEELPQEGIANPYSA